MGILASFKAEFHRKNQDLIARISNIRWSLECLQRSGNDILPASDAASFKAAVQPMLQSLDDAKSILLEADRRAEAIILINR